MKRRAFLTTTTFASVGLSTAFISGCSTAKNRDNSDLTVDSYKLFELDEETISSLADKLSSGTYSSEQLVKLFMHRIAAIDKKGPRLNSIIELNPDALSIAKIMDLELKSNKRRGPLHGIPVLIKDNIDTADKMQKLLDH